MTTLFECESEIGKCETGALEDASPAESTYSVLAQTTAFLNGSKRLLIIEQRCYLRNGSDIPTQPWVKPEMLVEAANGSTDDLIRLAREKHETFVAKVRRAIPEEHLSQIANP